MGAVATVLGGVCWLVSEPFGFPLVQGADHLVDDDPAGLAAAEPGVAEQPSGQQGGYAGFDGGEADVGVQADAMVAGEGMAVGLFCVAAERGKDDSFVGLQV